MSSLAEAFNRFGDSWAAQKLISDISGVGEFGRRRARFKVFEEAFAPLAAQKAPASIRFLKSS